MNSQPNHFLVDSSVIIALVEVNMANVLVALDMETFVHHAVYREVVVRDHGRPGSEELRDLIRQGKVRILKPRDRALIEAIHYTLGL